MLFRQRLLRLLFWQYKWSTNLLAARTVPLPEQAAASSYLLILGELKGEGWYKIVILIALESLNLPYYWVFCWKSDFRGWIYLQSLVKTPETGVFDADEEAEMDQALLAARCLFWEYGKYSYKRHRLWRWVLGFFCSGWSSYCKTNVRPQIRRFGRGFGISHEWHLYIYDIPHNTSQLVVSPNLYPAGRAGESGWSQLGLCISSRGGWTPSVEGDSSSISTTLTAEKKVHHSREAVDGNCENTCELSFLGPSTGWWCPDVFALWQSARITQRHRPNGATDSDHLRQNSRQPFESQTLKASNLCRSRSLSFCVFSVAAVVCCWSAPERRARMPSPFSANLWHSCKRYDRFGTENKTLPIQGVLDILSLPFLSRAFSCSSCSWLVWWGLSPTLWQWVSEAMSCALAGETWWNGEGFSAFSTSNKLRQQYYTFEYDLGLWPFGAVQVIKAPAMAVLQRQCFKDRLPQCSTKPVMFLE